MKLLAVLVTILSVSICFAGNPKLDAPLVIADSVTLNSPVKPDSMTSGMSVSFKSYDALPVTSAMERITAVVKSHADICSFSGYQISPIYKYVENAPVRDGYNGTIDFTCSFKDMAKYDSVVGEVFAISAADSNFTVTSRPVKWIVSEGLSLLKSSELKTSALKQIQQIAKSYGKIMLTYCKVKDISFDYDAYQPVHKENNTKVSRAAAITEPDKTDFLVSLTAKFKMTCK